MSFSFCCFSHYTPASHWGMICASPEGFSWNHRENKSGGKGKLSSSSDLIKRIQLGRSGQRTGLDLLGVNMKVSSCGQMESVLLLVHHRNRFRCLVSVLRRNVTDPTENKKTHTWKNEGISRCNTVGPNTKAW